MSVSRVSRASRAAMFAAVCVLLAALGHVLMSGSPLSWPVPVLAAGGVAVVGWAVGGKERRQRTVVALTLAVQTGLHIAFTLAQTVGEPSAASPGQAAGAQDWARFLLCGGDPSAQVSATARDVAVGTGVDHMGLGHMGTAHMAMGDMAGAQHMGTGHMGMAHMGMGHMGGMTGTASWGMLLAHLTAALLCGLWLAQGERAVFRLLRAMADSAFVPLRLVLAVLPVVSGPPPIRPASTRPVRLRARLLVHALTTRGPPGEPAVL